MKLVATAWRALVPMVFSTGALAATPCPLPAPVLEQGALQVAWQVEGAPIEVGQHFTLELRLCPADGVLLRVDATMPEHRHGMNYRPSLARIGPGHWRAEGLMFHMPGRWQLRFEVRNAGQVENLLDTIELP